MTNQEYPTLGSNSTAAGADSAAVGARLASIVHDFNNLLTPIVNILNDLQRKKVGSERQARRIDGAIFCAYRAGILARQLLDEGRLHHSHPAVVHIDEFLAGFEPVLSGAIHPNIALRIETAANLPPIQFDQELLERALLNLVLNARDAMHNGGNLVVSALIDRPIAANSAQVDFMVRLSVSDTGAGMSKATIDRAGEPRFSTKTNGSGLGLMTVKQILERHNGKLSITSVENCGTTVDLWLPLARVPSGPGSSA